MSKPFYTSAAERDLTQILQYIAEDNPDAALAWIKKIESKCLLIADNPGIGELHPKLGEGVRANVVGALCDLPSRGERPPRDSARDRR